ncbi:WbqC family protein [Thiomicrorhabdus hydrogeniphila]
MSKVAICQPTYLSWMGYFEMIQSVDSFVFLDNVQFQKQSWQSRNRIKDNQDSDLWLSVPLAAHKLEDKIFDIKIASSKFNWQRKHLNSIKTYLGKTPFLTEVLELVEASFDEGHTNLADLNIHLITRVSEKLGLSTTFYRASDLNINGIKTDLLLNLLTELNASSYLANQGSKSYLQYEEQRFQDLDIKLIYQNWEPPVYQQRGKQFVDKLAWVDPISHLGFNQTTLLE